MNKSIFKPLSNHFLREFFFKLEKNVLKFSKAKNNFEFFPKYVSFLHKFETQQKPESDFEKRQKSDPTV